MYASATAGAGIVIGPDGLARVRAATRLPVCATGGMTAENAPGLVATGIELIAVSSEIHDAADPYAAARHFIAALAMFPDPARSIAP